MLQRSSETIDLKVAALSIHHLPIIFVADSPTGNSSAAPFVQSTDRVPGLLLTMMAHTRISLLKQVYLMVIKAALKSKENAQRVNAYLFAF